MMSRSSWLALVMMTAGCGGPAQDRVAEARKTRAGEVKALVQNAGLKSPLKRLYLRAFKAESQLELWGADAGSAYKRIKTYNIARQSGNLGPKRKEGDLQVPEGFYRIDRFNPQSRFHLSLGLNYPNASDKILSDKAKPGSDIFIHGSNVSIGCLAMTDDVIELIYLMALDARSAGIPVHIFPFRMTDQNLKKYGTDNSGLKPFWSQLKPGYDRFEKTKTVPTPRVDPKTGQYLWS